MPASSPRLILGSSSPRRMELLGQINIIPDVIQAADIDESPRKGELPEAYVTRIAAAKNAALAAQFPHDFILTADTTGVLGRRILGKSQGEAEAERVIRLLSGRAHRIITAICLKAPDGRIATRVNSSRIKVKRLSETEIKTYVASNEWENRACGYHFGGIFNQFILTISGSPSGILGLPLYEVAQLLKGLGYHGNQA